jgi:hypothetical protein
MKETDRLIVHGLGSALIDELDWLDLAKATEIARNKLQQANVLLGQCWSEMACRNLLSDMLRILKVIERDPAVTGSDEAKDLCKDLKNLCETHLDKHSPSRRQYDAALCVGYKVKTAGSKYSGKSDDHQDMVQRCNDMKAAVRAAYRLADEMGSHNSNSKMLKIFMAPEFFFRGRNGAYDHEVVYGLRGQDGLLDLMKQEIDKDIYDDWLFVLGTVIVATRRVESACGHSGCPGPLEMQEDSVSKKRLLKCKSNPGHTKIKEVTKGAQVDNIALVYKQGETYAVAKELVSGIDYVANREEGLRNVVKVRGRQLPVGISPTGAADPQSSRFKDERMGGSIFTIGGVTFGLEVCLDHAARVDSDDTGRLEHAANIQIQLIPSAGMHIGAFRTVDRGITFNVDGVTPHCHVVRAGLDNLRSAKFQSGLLRLSKSQKFLNAVKRAFGETVGAPRISRGLSGAVVGFGPFDIPDV